MADGAKMTSLNIKNETTHMLAERLARMTGETLTTAVTRALSERIARIEGPDSLADELLTIGRDCARHLKEPQRSLDHADLLYD
jgi:antitoxin VapB